MEKKVEPTTAEQRNGWTAGELERYLKERARAQQRVMDFQQRVPRKPPVANSGYNPKRWI